MAGCLSRLACRPSALFRRAGVAAVALAALTAAAAPAQETHKSTPDDQKSIAITIYNQDLGLVKDVRTILVPRGTLNLKFEGVAAAIDPTSVHIRSLDHPRDLSVLEQNFEYDLISPAKLMEKYLGRTVELVVWRENEGETRSEGRLVGIQGGYVYEMDGKIAINPEGRVILPAIPEGLISKPTLMWMLNSGRREHTVEASYLTSGIGWRANYVLVLSADDTEIDLSGWVTIDNHSGATYENASIKLVAGDVHRAAVPKKMRPMARGVFDAAAPMEEQFAQQAFFEYHLYTLQRPSTIKNNQTKQIGLLDARGASVQKHYIYSPSVPYWFSSMAGPDKSTKVGVHLEFENSEGNNLGMPLPKGIVRVYKKDDDEALQFIGEDAIDHTPEDEEIRVKMGDAFDIVAERVQTSFKILQSGHLYESAYKVEIRNHKEEPIVVTVVEVIPGDWQILEKSHDYDSESSNRVHFDVPVEAKGKAELTYRVRIKY
jgi:hypothetical protein